MYYDDFIFNKRLDDVYDCEGYTTAEVLSYFYNKINDFVERFNDLEGTTQERLDYLLGEGLSNEVANKLNEMYENGTLQNIIDNQLFGSINERVTQNTNNIAINSENILKEKQNVLNIVDEEKFKNQAKGGISVTIKNTTSDDEFNSLFSKVKDISDNAILVLMISPTTETSTSFNTITTQTFNKIKTYAEQYEITFDILKIHLVTNFDDGNSSKGKITPTSGNENLWFGNYYSSLLPYLDFCKSMNITKLVMCNENILLTSNLDLLNNWIDTITKIKNYYPQIKLSISTTGYERNLAIIRKKNNIKTVFDYLDFISINTYPSVSYYNISDEVSESENLMCRNVQIKQLIIIIKQLNLLFNKPIVITEIGNTGHVNGLKYPVFTGSNFTLDTTVREKYFKIVLPLLASLPEVKNIYIWRINDIFSPYNESAKDYLKEFYSTNNKTTLIDEKNIYSLQNEEYKYISSLAPNSNSPWLRVGYLYLENLIKMENSRLLFTMDIKSSKNTINAKLNAYIEYNSSNSTFSGNYQVFSKNNRDLKNFIKFGIEENNTKATLYVKNEVSNERIIIDTIKCYFGNNEGIFENESLFLFFYPYQYRSWMLNDYSSLDSFYNKIDIIQYSTVKNSQSLTTGENNISFTIMNNNNMPTIFKIPETGYYEVDLFVYIRANGNINSEKITVALLEDTTVKVNSTYNVSCDNSVSFPIHLRFVGNLVENRSLSVKITKNETTYTFRVLGESNISIKKL